MFKFLIGPALLGLGYLAGSIYGRDAEQLVHKSPAVTYAAVENALTNMRRSGTTFFDGGTPMPYEIQVDHAADQGLVIHLLFAGREGATADLNFASQNNGKDTLVVAKVHGNREVLQAALAGTSRAKLAWAPDWMLNLSARSVLREFARQIEEGEDAQIEGLTSADAQAQWEANLTDEQRQQVTRWRQYEATRPAVDPNADAQNYTSGASSTN
jgi:hypothetical protein